MSNKKAKQQGRAKRQEKRNLEPIYQPCCGAPKNGHYSDCKKKGS